MPDPEAAPLAPRAAFSAGEFLTRFAPGSPHALRLDCVHEKPGWQARLPGGLIEAEFAGTAVYFEDRFYEVVAARSVGGWTSYYLDPWREEFVLRRVVTLSAEESAREAAERARATRQRGAATALVLATPIVGLLPAELQERIERRYGLPASRATAISAALLLAVSTVLWVLGLAAAFAGAEGASGAEVPRAYGLAKYYMFESLFRLGAALAAEEANGTMPAVFVWQLVKRVLPGRRRDTGGESASFAVGRVRRGLGGLAERDEVRPLAGDPPRLEVISLLAKPHWSRSTGIRYGDAWYRLEASEAPRREGEPWRFVLAADPEALTMRGACDYDPTEVVALLRQAAIARRAPWAETLAPLWGWLTGDEQRRLAALYDYAPLRATGWSILAGIVFGGLGAGLAAFYLAAGAGDVFDFLMLVGAGVMLADALRRFWPWRGGQIVASWLAPLARPFARRLVSVSSPPAAR